MKILVLENQKEYSEIIFQSVDCYQFPMEGGETFMPVKKAAKKKVVKKPVKKVAAKKKVVKKVVKKAAKKTAKKKTAKK